MSFVRAATRAGRLSVRVPTYRATPIARQPQRAFSQSVARYSDAHAEETFEEFSARYDAFLVGKVPGLGGQGTRSSLRAIGGKGAVGMG